MVYCSEAINLEKRKQRTYLLPVLNEAKRKLEAMFVQLL